MPTLDAFEARDVYTRSVTRATDAAGLASVRERADRGLRWAVGALVEDDAGRALFVRDDGTWMLPGGGVEAGESRTEAVVREVREETGVEITVDELLAVTEVTVTHAGDAATFFFGTYRGTPASTATDDDPGLPEEAIDRVAWRETLPENCLDRELLARVR